MSDSYIVQNFVCKKTKVLKCLVNECGETFAFNVILNILRKRQHGKSLHLNPPTWTDCSC